MPFTRISLLRGKSPDYLKSLSDNFHRAMVESFSVPPDDRFQAIHQLEPGELVFDRAFLGISRSDDFVLFDITVGKPRTTEVKQAFYRRLVDLLSDAPGIRPEDVMIAVTTTERQDWSFGNGVAQLLQSA